MHNGSAHRPIRTLPGAPILFRCARPGEGPFGLALIAHPSTQTSLRRARMPPSEARAGGLFWSREGICGGAGAGHPHGATRVGAIAEDRRL